MSLAQLRGHWGVRPDHPLASGNACVSGFACIEGWRATAEDPGGDIRKHEDAEVDRRPAVVQLDGCQRTSTGMPEGVQAADTRRGKQRAIRRSAP